MRFMIMIKSTTQAEAGVMHDERVLTEMVRYNEELVKAGVMLAGEGLHPSSHGARVRVADGKHTVIDGPFPDARELVAGFWLLQLRSLDEAIAWVKRVPIPNREDFEIEIRQVFEADDFTTHQTISCDS